ncbi:hypothetical protein PM082_017432 [Marasmius tenuissimus]|nr:hypothetical protein PM082_017432 [Marasmius tenuissimus]
MRVLGPAITEPGSSYANPDRGFPAKDILPPQGRLRSPSNSPTPPLTPHMAKVEFQTSLVRDQRSGSYPESSPLSRSRTLNFCPSQTWSWHLSSVGLARDSSEFLAGVLTDDSKAPKSPTRTRKGGHALCDPSDVWPVPP